MFSQCSYWRCRSSVTLHCVTVNNPWHTYIHTHTHIYTYIYYIHTHTYTYIHTHIHNTYIYTHIYITHTYTHTYIPTYIHISIHTHIHTYIHTFQRIILPSSFKILASQKTWIFMTIVITAIILTLTTTITLWKLHTEETPHLPLISRASRTQ